MAEELDDVERHDLAGVRAAGDQPAVGRHRSQVLGEPRARRSCRRRRRRRGPPVASATASATGDVAVAEHDVGAELAHRLDLVRRADRGDHARAGDPRRLDGRAGDPARRRRHQHRLAGPRPPPTIAPSTRPSRRRTARPRPARSRPPPRSGMTARAGTARQLGVAAPAVGAEHDEALAQIRAPAHAGGAARRTRTAGRPSPGRPGRCPRPRRRPPSTVPANSAPSTQGIGNGQRDVPARESRSLWFRPHALHRDHHLVAAAAPGRRAPPSASPPGRRTRGRSRPSRAQASSACRRRRSARARRRRRPCSVARPQRQSE